MKFATPILVIIFFTSCNLRSNKLQSQAQTITLEFVAFACDCANWVELKDFDKPNYADSAIFIEPADSSLILPDTLAYSMNIITFTGQFYKEKGYPEGYHSIEKPDRAKVFRYTKFSVIKCNYSESQKFLKEIDD